jgi:hypothetical protein
MSIPSNFKHIVDTTGDWKLIAVIGLGNDGVQGQFIQNVFLSVPPSLLDGSFRIDGRRQDFVVVVMIVIPTFMGQDSNFFQPLDHSPTNVACAAKER